MAKICVKCNKEFPFRIKIDGKIKNLNNRRYCLECSPFGKHNTRKIEVIKRLAKYKICLMCNTKKSNKHFYVRRDGTEMLPYCKPCTSLQKIQRNRKFKQECIKYKGGKCQRCSYNKCNNALEFHHIDQKQKDFSISEVRNKDMNNKVKSELDKCMLLCANCHREIHEEIWHARQDSNLRPLA